MSNLEGILESLEKMKTIYVIEYNYEKAAIVRELIIKVKEKIMERDLSFGEKLVGLDFNPSGNEKVQRVKELCAELADLLNENADPNIDRPLCRLLFDKAIGDILDAQMNVVKVLTFKY
jgi:hypothetical protein